MKYRLFIACGLLGLFSCKNEKVKEEAKSEPFQVSLDLVVKQDDSLQLYYREEGMENYEEGKSVLAIVKGNAVAQPINFSLPEDVLPAHLRIDFANNKQEPVEFKGFGMKYYDKTFQTKDTLFFQYFYPNEYIDWDRKNAVAKFKNIEGKKFDPSFMSRETLDSEILKLIN